MFSFRQVWGWIRQRFGFCSECGRRYRRIYGRNSATFGMIADKGKACPEGHEGFIDVFYGFGMVRMWHSPMKVAWDKALEVPDGD